MRKQEIMKAKGGLRPTHQPVGASTAEEAKKLIEAASNTSQ